MFIDMRRTGVIFSAFLMISTLGLGRTGAATVEVDDEASQPKAAASSEPPAGEPEADRARVRINDKIGFYYFLKAGFVVPDDSKVSSIGKILESSRLGTMFSTGDKTSVDLSSKQSDLKKGDLLVIYRSYKVEEAKSGFSGWWIRNLAVVKVLEIEKRRCIVEVQKSFFPYMAGDRVRSYDDETARWKQAQVKKTLPDHAVDGFVALLDPEKKMVSQSDFFVLTVGSKKGVVEGQRFQLKKTLYGGGEPVHANEGIGEVFYVGPNASMAQVIFSDTPIHDGFAAVSQP